MTGIGFAIICPLALAILFAPRRWALLALCAGMLYLTLAQYVVVAGFSLFPMRILALAGLTRVLLRGDYSQVRWNRLDFSLMFVYAYTVAVFCIRSDEEIAFRIGWGLDAVLFYVVFRALARDVSDVVWLLRGMSILMLPFVAAMLAETTTFRNQFEVIGGVPLIAEGDMWIREGRLRATGSFGHPSLAGTFGATFLPLYLSLFLVRPAHRAVGLLGTVLCLAIVWAANSGGPSTCVAAAIAAWMLWPMRHAMQVVRRLLAAVLIVLTFVMNAPIWYLLARISDITGGGGYHRAVLMDVAFQELDKWWFAGMSMRETRGWLAYTNSTTGVVDLTNNYLNFGVAAGLSAMVIFIAVIVIAYSRLGRAMASLRESPDTDMNAEPLYWGLGAMLTVHVVNWFGITYWDQSGAMWLLHLAMIGSLTGVVAVATTEQSEQVELAQATT
jgi:hypothetical protein